MYCSKPTYPLSNNIRSGAWVCCAEVRPRLRWIESPNCLYSTNLAIQVIRIFRCLKLKKAHYQYSPKQNSRLYVPDFSSTTQHKNPQKQKTYSLLAPSITCDQPAIVPLLGNFTNNRGCPIRYKLYLMYRLLHCIGFQFWLGMECEIGRMSWCSGY